MKDRKMVMCVEFWGDSWVFTLNPFTHKPDMPASMIGISTEFAKEISQVYESLTKSERLYCPRCGKPLFVGLDIKTSKPTYVTCVQNRTGANKCFYGTDYEQYLSDLKEATGSISDDKEDR
jgi:hypothetical protein